MEVFRFENSEMLYLLLLIPIFIGLFIWLQAWRKRALKLFGDKKVVSQLLIDVSRSRPILKFIIFLTAFASLVIGLANPQIGSQLEKVKREGIDLIIALDVSTSMNAQDIKPSRMESSKRAISRLVDKLQGDRIGIVVFAGQAFMQLPITTDYSAAKMFLSTINTDIVSTQGTALGEAIKRSMLAFNFEDKRNKAIIIITDGENHEGDVLAEAKRATEKGVRIFTIGMGLPEGGPIPVLNAQGRQTGFKKDKSGNTVVTRLNEQMLQQIASAGNGSYVRANNGSAGLSRILEDINSMEKSEIEAKVFSDYEDRFQYFIGFAFFLLLFEMFILEKKSKMQKIFRLFD